MKKLSLISLLVLACTESTQSSTDCAMFLWRTDRELPSCVSPPGISSDLACFRTPEEALAWARAANIDMCNLRIARDGSPYVINDGKALVFSGSDIVPYVSIDAGSVLQRTRR